MSERYGGYVPPKETNWLKKQWKRLGIGAGVVGAGIGAHELAQDHTEIVRANVKPISGEIIGKATGVNQSRLNSQNKLPAFLREQLIKKDGISVDTEGDEDVSDTEARDALFNDLVNEINRVIGAENILTADQIKKLSDEELDEEKKNKFLIYSDHNEVRLYTPAGKDLKSQQLFTLSTNPVGGTVTVAGSFGRLVGLEPFVIPDLVSDLADEYADYRDRGKDIVGSSVSVEEQQREWTKASIDLNANIQKILERARNN